MYVRTILADLRKAFKESQEKNEIYESEVEELGKLLEKKQKDRSQVCMCEQS